MNTSTIVQINKGQVPERSVIEAVAKAYPTVFGHATQHDGEIEYEVTDKPWSVDEIMKLVEHEELRNDTRILFFGNWKKFEDETDILPYVMTPDGADPILAYFVEGDFDNFANLNGKHVGEYCLAEEVLTDIFEKFTGDDEDKFILGLKSDKCKTLVHDAIKTRGWLTFLPKTGEPWSIGKNDQMLGFPWGSISNKADIELPEARAAEPTKKKFSMSFLGKKKAEAAPEPVKEEPKPVKDPAVVEPAKEPEPVHDPKTDTAVTWRKTQVPPHLTSGVRNAWIRLFNGDRAIGIVGGEGALPGDHMSKTCHISVHPSLVPFLEHKVTDTKSIKELREKVLKGDKSIPKDMKEASKSTVREAYVPSDSAWDNALEKYVKFLDASGKKRPSPIEIQKSEGKRTVFSQKLGIDFNEMFLRTPEEISELFDGNEIATDAYIEMRRYAIEKSGLKLEDLVTASTKGEEPKVENTEAVNDKPTKKTGGGLSFLKKNKAA